MNTISINFQSFLDWDNSPFILFDSKSKILYLNNSAEILFGYVSKKELYDLALAYAPQNFGYKTTTLTLNYNSFTFYAITVGYEDENQISIRFYNAPRIKTNIPINKDKFITTNINLLLEANIVLFKTKNSNSLQLLTDHEIPNFKLDQNLFSKLLRKTLESFENSNSIYVTLGLLTGEHMIIDGKKNAIVQLSIKAKERVTTIDEEIKKLSSDCYVAHFFTENSIKLDIPLIN